MVRQTSYRQEMVKQTSYRQEMVIRRTDLIQAGDGCKTDLIQAGDGYTGLIQAGDGYTENRPHTGRRWLYRPHTGRRWLYRPHTGRRWLYGENTSVNSLVLIKEKWNPAENSQTSVSSLLLRYPACIDWGKVTILLRKCACKG